MYLRFVGMADRAASCWTSIEQPSTVITSPSSSTNGTICAENCYMEFKDFWEMQEHMQHDTPCIIRPANRYEPLKNTWRCFDCMGPVTTLLLKTVIHAQPYGPYEFEHWGTTPRDIVNEQGQRRSTTSIFASGIPGKDAVPVLLRFTSTLSILVSSSSNSGLPVKQHAPLSVSVTSTT